MLYLASAGQDNFVRVYQIWVKTASVTNNQEFDIEVLEFPISTKTVAVKLDTVLMGHENWVYGVSFHSSRDGTCYIKQ